MLIQNFFNFQILAVAIFLNTASLNSIFILFNRLKLIVIPFIESEIKRFGPTYLKFV